MNLRCLAALLALAAGLAAPGRALAADPCRFPARSEVRVSTASALTTALAEARPGQRIRLAPGTYAGRFRITRSGTAEAPIVLCGPREAVLDSGIVASGYTLHLDTARYWKLSGFTVHRGKDGVMLDRSSRNWILGLRVHGTGHSGIHLRTNSRVNVVAYNEIHDTGRYVAGYGEGIYVGTAKSNWADVMGSSSTPDRSDRNRVRYNHIGPNVAAEAIDIKEGTTGGQVVGNTFDGTGMTGENYADSWIDVKGNGWLIRGNTGHDTLRDAFQVHVVLEGWGHDNVFEDNLAVVNGPGLGFSIHDLARGTVVACDNQVEGASEGFANIPCAP